MGIDLEKVDRIIEKYGNDATLCLELLQEINGTFRYLPREALVRVAEKNRTPLSQLYAMATFYKSFNLTPRGEHEVCVCMGTACHVRGAPRILERAEEILGIRAGETSADGKYTLQTVNCLGACALGPLVTVDGQYHGKLNTARVEKLLRRSPDEDAQEHN